MSINIYSKSEDYYVCKNIKHFCDFAGMDIKESPEYKEGTNKYIYLCKKGDRTIKIIYIPIGSRYSKPADLNQLLSADSEFVIIKNSHIKKIKTTSLSVKVKVLDSKYFLVNQAKRFMVCGYKMRIVPKEEVNHIMKLYKIYNIKCFSAISINAHEVIWLDAKLDDIIYLEYPTTASCEVTSNYKIVSTEVPLIEDEEEETD